MTNKMTYKGYTARIDYDDEDGIFFGRLAGIRDTIGFHADTVDELRRAFHEAVDDYLETCTKLELSPQKAYSGQVMVRIDPDIHRRVALAADLEGKSINQWVERLFAEATASLTKQV